MSEPPDWVTSTPSTPGVHPSGSEQTAFTRPDFLLKLPNFVLQLVEKIIGTVVKAIVGIFIPGDVGSAVGQLSNWATVLLPKSIIDFVIELIKKFLDPFGLGDEIDGTGADPFGDALSLLLKVWTAPLSAIGQLFSLFGNLQSSHGSEIASLKAQVSVLHQSKTTVVSPGAGWDPCIDASGFDTPLIGTLTPTGYGTLTASGLAVAHYTTSPSLERNQVGLWVKSKRKGQTGLHFCSDDTMTNYVRLLFDIAGNGRDTVSLVTGTGPDSGYVVRRSMVMRLPADAYWGITYEPFNEDSPTSNNFHVFMSNNEVEALRWPDAGNEVLHTAGNLRWGILLNGLDDASHRGYDATDVSYGANLTGAPV